MSETNQQTSRESATPPIPPSELLAEADKTFPTGSSSLPTGAEQPQVEQSGAAPSTPQAAPFAFHQHAYVTEYIKLADQKAAFVFAVATGTSLTAVTFMFICAVVTPAPASLTLKSKVANGEPLEFVAGV